MRIEKTFLLNEISAKVKDSDFLYLVDFSRVTVAEIAALRKSLLQEGAQFHVVQNTLLKKVGEALSLPAFTNWLVGQTAIVFGGSNPSGVAKILLKFAKEKDKLATKGGVLDGQLYDIAAIEALSKLPDLPTLRATLLSLLLTPYRQCLYVMQGVPQALLNVLQAHQKKAGE